MGIDNINQREIAQLHGVSDAQISYDVKDILKKINSEERGHIQDFINSLLRKFREKEKQIDQLCKSGDRKAYETWLKWSSVFLDNLHKLGVDIGTNGEITPQVVFYEINFTNGDFEDWCKQQCYNDVLEKLEEFRKFRQQVAKETGQSGKKYPINGKPDIEDYKRFLERDHDSVTDEDEDEDDEEEIEYAEIERVD